MIYEFANYSLDVARRELRCGGRSIHVEPQTFDVLEYLVANRERVVSKDDLIAAVWKGRIVSESTLSSSVTTVRKAVGDSSEAQRLIRTIPRKGFRFIGEVRQAPSSEVNASAPPIGHQATLSLPDKPSIAVLPFANFSGDPEQGYFADGMVDEIITALSRIPWLFVIARTSTFSYKDKAIDIRQVGKDLGVRYVLEGSVRREADRVRIMPQLIDATTGAHLWAERFEGSIDRIFDLQDQVTEKVVGALAPKLHQAETERVRRKPTHSLDAYDYYLRGMASFHRLSKEGIEEAVGLFRKAVDLDPGYASACGMTAICYVRRKASRNMADEKQETAEALQFARWSVELGPEDPIALSTGGFALAYLGSELDVGTTFIDRALELSPNLASAFIFSGWTRILLGDQAMAIKHFKHSMRLSPLDPFIMSSYSGIAFAHLLMGETREAATWAQTAFQMQPKYFFTSVVCAAADALSGDLSRARQAIGRVREADPTFRVSNLAELEPLRDRQQLAIWAEGMRKAGLPD